MKINKVFFTLCIFLLLASCSNSEQLSLEEQLKSGLDNDVRKYGEIVYYEIKDDLIFVFYTGDENDISHNVLEYTPSAVNNISKGGSILMDGDFVTFEKEDTIPYYIAYFSSNNPDVEKVEFHDQYAKNIKYNDVNFWVIISEQNIIREELKAYDSSGNQVELMN